jgi:hypothetical protein
MILSNFIKNCKVKTENKSRVNKKVVFKTINENINKPKMNRESFCGSVKIDIDPVTYQRKMRNEWK